MIQAGNGARFKLESTEPVSVRGHVRMQHLDGDISREPPVVRAIDFAHAAGPKGRDVPGRRRGPTPRPPSLSSSGPAVPS